MAEGTAPEALHAGAERYAEFCNATGKVGTEYVMQAARFFDPSSEWEEAWSPPPVKVPRSKQEAGIRNLKDALIRRAQGTGRNGQ